MVSHWVYLTVGAVVSLIVLGVVAINTVTENSTREQRNSSSFISAKLAALRVAECAEIREQSKRAEYVSISSTLLDGNPKLKGVLEGADYRYNLLGGEKQCNSQEGGRSMDEAAELKITEEEANRLISVWKSYFIPSEVGERSSDDIMQKFYFIKVQVDDNFYFVTIYTVYTQMK